MLSIFQLIEGRMDRQKMELDAEVHSYHPKTSTAAVQIDTNMLNTDSTTTIINNISSGEADDWPDWANLLQCISHFLLTLYSSITFPIFCVKQKPFYHIERFIQRIPFIQKMH